MKIERRYTKSGQDAYHGLDFRKAVSEIKNPDGSIVFRLADIEVPSAWSQVASDILAQKYFRKAGVPVALKRVEVRKEHRVFAADMSSQRTRQERQALAQGAELHGLTARDIGFGFSHRRRSRGAALTSRRPDASQMHAQLDPFHNGS